jgi:hypothetical protein
MYQVDLNGENKELLFYGNFLYGITNYYFKDNRIIYGAPIDAEKFFKESKKPNIQVNAYDIKTKNNKKLAVLDSNIYRAFSTELFIFTDNYLYHRAILK